MWPELSAFLQIVLKRNFRNPSLLEAVTTQSFQNWNPLLSHPIPSVFSSNNSLQTHVSNFCTEAFFFFQSPNIRIGQATVIILVCACLIYIMCKFVNNFSFYFQFLHIQTPSVRLTTTRSAKTLQQSPPDRIHAPKTTTLVTPPSTPSSNPVSSASPLRKPRQQTVKLLDLSDDVLLHIFAKLLNPIIVNNKRRLVFDSIQEALPLASSNRRLFDLFTTFLTDIDLSNFKSCSSGTEALKFKPLRTVCHVAKTNLRRLYLRNSYSLSSDLGVISEQCTGLRTLDLSFIPAVDDELLYNISTKISGLSNVLIRKCRRVTDTGVMSLARHCKHLACLDIAAVSMITDRAVAELAKERKSTLRILVLSFCPRLTNACMPFLSQLRLSALFLRSTCISDFGVRCLMRESVISESLQTIDLLDCPHVTGVSFNILWTFCTGLREILRDHGGLRPGSLRNAVSLLDGYIRVITITDHGTNCRVTYVVACDAGSLNAVEQIALVHGEMSLDPEQVRILGYNIGAHVSRGVGEMMKQQYGIVV